MKNNVVDFSILSRFFFTFDRLEQHCRFAFNVYAIP